jgi:hypothetical protein
MISHDLLSVRIDNCSWEKLGSILFLILALAIVQWIRINSIIQKDNESRKNIPRPEYE